MNPYDQLKVVVLTKGELGALVEEITDRAILKYKEQELPDKLSITQAAAYVGRTPKTIHAWAALGKVKKQIEYVNHVKKVYVMKVDLKNLRRRKR